MNCVVCLKPIPAAVRSTRRYCSAECTYWARARRDGRRVIPPPEQREDGGYAAVHHRLRVAFGAASNHTCGCGEPATEWAYDNTHGPHRKVGHEGLAYSTDLSHYRAMCRPCHKRMDAAAAGRARCGTDAGYYRHRRTGAAGPPCRECKTAHAVATYARNARRADVLTEYDQEAS